MDLRNLKTFHVVAQCLNFTKAAELLNYSQPTISQQIKVLEEELHHPLFNRMGKKLYLTEVGKMLYKHTGTLFAFVEEIEEDLRQFDSPFGRLTVAASEFYCSFYLGAIMSDFLKGNKDVHFSLVCATSETTVQLLQTNEADIGITAGYFELSGVEHICIDEEDLVLVAHAEVDAQCDLSLLFEQYPFITYGMVPMIQRCLDELNCRPKTIVEVGSEDAIKEAVIGGAGIALLSDLILQKEIESGAVQVLARFPKRLQTYMMYPSDMKDFQNVQAFVKLIEKRWLVIRQQRSVE
ncbi:LysR family transcriptional regulator [Savagea sp. SN6]|uniref:LysR family transcriptional regulator n=1 Tax=Savagea serpentis TaxID=2785297 RepID=A0A8J7KE77_9BACL|nr:LysR family transcriptional regulator [Savagea serpentis]